MKGGNMIELELFFERVNAGILSAQARYLKKQKSRPFEQELPEVEEITAEKYVKLSFFQRLRYFFVIRKQRRRYRKALRKQRRPVDEDLTYGYNAGIELALSVLSKEYKTLISTLQEDES